jgi:hypothetical protein
MDGVQEQQAVRLTDELLVFVFSSTEKKTFRDGFPNSRSLVK